MSKIKSITDFIREHFTIFLIIAEISLGILIIAKISYTEIDWVAYMQQIEIFLGGERDYVKIRGQTGPLVYPAGHVYIFTGLYYMTNYGKDIFLAQCIFLVIYVAQIYILTKIYNYGLVLKTHYWWIVGLLFLSRRVHSIYMLRCFNDGIAMFLAYIAIYFLLKSSNQKAVFFFSLAISVKMNVLLFLPGIYLILSRSEGIWKGTYYLLQILLMQIVIGIPFINENPASYFNKAFEFKREFLFKWSVNWNYLGEELATDPKFALALLSLHLLFLIFFLLMKWVNLKTIFKELSVWPFNLFPKKKFINPEYTLNVLFICNFIGIIFARSLHYQFYSWYFHTLPWLLICCRIYPSVIKIAILIGIEVCWNLFPPSALWSATLSVLHLLILLGLVLKKPINEIYFQEYKPKID